MYRTDSFELSRDSIAFQITFSSTNEVVVQSLIKTRLLPGAYTNEHFSMVRFKADTVKPLTTFQQERTTSVAQVAKMIRCLSKQIAYLLETEHCVYMGFHPNNVLIINNEVFLYVVGSEWVVPCDPDTNQVTISCPFTTADFFVSPELRTITSLPAEVHFKMAYFSFACLLLSVILRGDNTFYEEYLTHKREPKEMLDLLARHPIKDTRIFWLLSRCLVEDPTKRSIILL